MPEYLVTWEIELDAESPEDAAEQARQIQLDPDNIATYFTVRATGGKSKYRVEVGPNTVAITSEEKD